MSNKERDFKKWFREHCPFWIESYEPRRGSGVGIPDLQIAIDGILFPIELKTGAIDDWEVCWPDEVRPDQIGWHKRAGDAQISTFLCIGVKKTDGWSMLWVDGLDMRHWSEGYEVNGRMCRLIDDWSKLSVQLFKPAMHRRLLRSK